MSSLTAVSCLIDAGVLRSKRDDVRRAAEKVVSVPTATPFGEMSDTVSICVPLVIGVTLPAVADSAGSRGSASLRSAR